jgi:phosphoribosylformylglycinamidine synthase PurS subunit
VKKTYKITTVLKPGILDNAGKATTNALSTLGFDIVKNVRIGKTITLICNEEDIEKIATSQSNEVMETYTVEELK